MNFPAWHDADGWNKLLAGLKETTGVTNVTIEFDTPYGLMTYAADYGDDE